MNFHDYDVRRNPNASIISSHRNAREALIFSHRNSIFYHHSKPKVSVGHDLFAGDVFPSVITGHDRQPHAKRYSWRKNFSVSKTFFQLHSTSDGNSIRSGKETGKTDRNNNFPRDTTLKYDKRIRMLHAGAQKWVALRELGSVFRTVVYLTDGLSHEMILEFK